MEKINHVQKNAMKYIPDYNKNTGVQAKKNLEEGAQFFLPDLISWEEKFPAFQQKFNQKKAI